MDGLTEILKASLYDWGELIETFFNFASIISIVVGFAISMRSAYVQGRRMKGEHPLHSYFRKVFGGWLIVALEFQLAADIVGTVITPDYERLIQLGAVALIRTFLNYFLSRELEDVPKLPKPETTVN